MEYELWLGSEASFNTMQKYLTQFQFNKEAFLRSPFDRQEEPETDATFGVDSSRIGLTIMKKVGDRTVIEIRGSLTQSFSRWHAWFPGEATSYEAIRDALAIAQESGQKDVLLNIDSGGGSTRGINLAVDAIRKYSAFGNIDAHTDGVMASAAYWIGATAKRVTASEMAEGGSIGVMAVLRNYVDTEKNMGVKFTVLKAGKFKAVGNPFEELTKENQAYLQKNIDETNAFFLNHVSRQRNLMVSAADVWADGQVFYAREAVRVGLFDKVANIDDLFEGGSAASNPSDTRRAEMEISAEKLAQIQAGAKPEDVLTASELLAYNAMLEKNASESAAEPKDEKPAAEATAEAETEADKEANVNANASVSDALAKALKENGKLEAQLEAAQAQLKVAQESLVAAEASAKNLMVVAQLANTNMQVALNLPREAKGTVTEVLAQHEELRGKMAALFPTGKQSKKDDVSDPTRRADNVHSINPRFAEIPNGR